MAPEILSKAPYAGPPVDMWALGALVYELLHAAPAFRASSMAMLEMRILRASHTPIGAATSAGARSLIKRLLLVSPAARLSAEILLAEPWLAQAA